MSPPPKKEKTWIEMQKDLEAIRKEKAKAFILLAQGPTPEQKEKHRLEREKESISHLQNQIEDWKKGRAGEIIHHAQKALEFVHWSTAEILAKKQKLVQLELQFNIEKKKAEQEIIEYEQNQSQRKIQYDLCMDAVKQDRKFAPLPKPIPAIPEPTKPVKKSTKKKKMVEIEVEDDDVRDGSPSSPPVG
jgi:hypothetical protein